MNLSVAVQSALISMAGALAVILLRWLLDQPRAVEQARRHKEAEAAKTASEQAQLEIREQKRHVELERFRLEQQMAIQKANEETADKLRRELQVDLDRQRERSHNLETELDDVRSKLNENKARLDGILVENQNLRLINQNSQRRISELEFRVQELTTDREILAGALRLAGIPLPADLYRRSETPEKKA